MLKKIFIIVAVFAMFFSFSTNLCQAQTRKKTVSMESQYKTLKLNKQQKSLLKAIKKEYKKGTTGQVQFNISMSMEDYDEIWDNIDKIKMFQYTDSSYMYCHFSSAQININFKDNSRTVYLVIIDMDNITKCINSSKNNQKKIKKIIKKLGINKKTSEKKAAIKINNYLVKHISYDYTYKRHDLSDALNGKSVCMGYSLAYQAICKTVGLKCQLILDEDPINGHMWNRVKINNKWKYVDVTWNDTLNENKYLLLTKKQMNKDHNPDFILNNFYYN